MEPHLLLIFHTELMNLKFLRNTIHGNPYILPVVHMMVHIQMMRQDQNLFSLYCPARNCNLSWCIVHLDLLTKHIFFKHLFRRSHGMSCLNIDQTEQRIRISNPVSCFILHHEVSEAHKAAELIRLCSNRHRLSKQRVSLCHDLPAAKHPHHIPFLQISDSNAKILGLKRGTVLKIIQQCFRLQMPGLIQLTVTNSCLILIHGIPHLPASDSESAAV